MKYSTDELKIFEQTDDPADALLENWGTKSENDVNRLVELLKVMERNDLVRLLYGALQVHTKYGWSV